jgi:2-desacetyl-2-hydroxyethyl bacteriochlorophyllide A dehydrogenase
VRGIVIAEDRTLQTAELPERAVEPDEVRIVVGYCGICGSDLHNKFMPDVAPAGTVLGHEFSGTVAEVGSAVTNVRVGDRATVLPFEYCGACDRCTVGLEHLCRRRPDTKIGGAFRFGAYAESVIVPHTTVYRVPDATPERHAALTEPLAVALHGVGLTEISPAQGVVVLGAGPIGAMTAIALRADGFRRVIVVEPNSTRRTRMATLGLRAVEPDEARAAVEQEFGVPPAAVFDCTGHPTGPALALGLLPARGQLIMLGITVDPAPVNMIELVGNEIIVRGAVAYTHSDFARALELIVGGEIPCEQIITAVRPLEEANETFDDLLSGQTDDVKVLLRPRH